MPQRLLAKAFTRPPKPLDFFFFLFRDTMTFFFSSFHLNRDLFHAIALIFGT